MAISRGEIVLEVIAARCASPRIGKDLKVTFCNVNELLHNKHFNENKERFQHYKDSDTNPSVYQSLECHHTSRKNTRVRASEQLSHITQNFPLAPEHYRAGAFP